MAANTGPDENTYQIPEVLLGDTFNIWKDITNTSTYKLNKMQVYAGVSTSDLVASTDSFGKLSMLLAGTIPTGHTFSARIGFGDQVVFGSGVTFNGPVTFNAPSFTVNANIVTIDDYNIVLGDTAAASDSNISAAGGGGLILNRGSGNSADWLWTPTSLYGITGMWSGDGHIGFRGVTSGLRPNAGGNLLVHGTGIRLDGGSTAEHGLLVSLGGNGTTTGRTVALSRYSPAGSTAFIEVENIPSNPSRPFVTIKDGANKKTIRQINTFSVGTPVRIDSSNGNYVVAQGNNAVNAEVVGIVSKATGTEFELTFVGEVFDIDWADISADGSVSGVTGAVYYLSTDIPGKVVNSAPTLENTVYKAVFIANTSSSVIVIPWTGGVIRQSVTLADSTSNTVTIAQINQFKPGDVVRFNYVAGGTALSYGSGAGATSAFYQYGTYVRADAKSSQTADTVAGMVVSTTPYPAPYVGINEAFNLMMDGFFSAPGITAINSGTPGPLQPGTNYFLSINSAGTTGALEGITSSLADSPPGSAFPNSINKPVLFATSPTTGYVYSYRGTQTIVTTNPNQIDVAEMLVNDIRAGQVGELAFRVNDPLSGNGYTVMTFAHPIASGVRGNVRIGPSSFTNTSSGAGATLSVAGTIVSGDVDATVGSVMLASRAGSAYPITLNTVGSQVTTGNTVIGYGVRTNSSGYSRSISDIRSRTALEVGTDGNLPQMRLMGYYNTAHANPGRTGGSGTISLTELMRVSGLTATFAGVVEASGGFSGTLTGAVVGNASTATTLQTARDFSLAGDVTASAISFNGSGNVQLTTAIANNSIADSKLQQIVTANKVANSATTATDANTANAIVARDASGNFNSNRVSLNTLRFGSADMNATAHTGSAPIIGARAWGKITPSGAATNPTSVVGVNISSVTRTGVGIFRVVLATALPASYAVVVSSAGQLYSNVSNRTTVNVVQINATTFDLYHSIGGNTSTVTEFGATNIISFIAIG